MKIVFSHANSFNADTYRMMFAALRQRGLEVQAIDQFGHDPRYPVTSNWPHLVQQLIDFAQPLVQAAGQPMFFVGHSLGGFLSLMAAAKAPGLVRGVLLLDAPVIGGWRATALGMAKRAQLVGAVSPGKVSRRRRNQWADAAEALAHFQSKRAFARWHPQVLADYISHGTVNTLVDGQRKRMLRFDRDIETAIYNTLPDNLEAMLKQHPVSCPVAFIGGTQSAEIRQVGMVLTQRVTHGRIMMLDGSHLFPMEQPLVTAAAIEAALLNLAVAAPL
ncbi:MAG: alpha/beta hydrolase [Rhodoferax ferrireducens]|uniref:Alpha/beta hydrolase n=1 Tax=Rhodoferax ferrireducens TaxID=192843 RepID=A0A1W9KUQ1_9BURK|nr:MAG: alpha/beta hydrolase [Rhodoferax ferrireducens]